MPEKFLQSISDLNLAELEDLVENSPDIVLRFDVSGRLTYLNRAAVFALAVDKGENHNFSDLAVTGPGLNWPALLMRLEASRSLSGLGLSLKAEAGAKLLAEAALTKLAGPGAEPSFWLIARPAKPGAKEGDLLAMNQSLRQRQYELEALKSLSDRLINIFDIKEGIRTLNNYLDEVLDYSAAAYFIVTPEDESGFIHSSHRKEPVSEGFLRAMRRELARRIEENGGDDLARMAASYVAAGAATEAWAAGQDKPGSFVFFPLKIGGTVLGGILIASRQSGLFMSGGGWLADAMVMTFLLFVVRWQTLGQAQKSRTETLVASLSDGIIMFNDKMRVILVNAQAAVYTGLGPEKLDLDRLDAATPGLDLKARLVEMLVKAKIQSVDKYRLNGRYYQFIFTPVKDNQGKVVSGAIILHDINRLVEIDQMKTDFVYIASHQLRTPLTGIKWFVKLLQKDMHKDGRKPTTRQRECLEQIIVANDLVIKLVNDLLSISRIESGHKFKIEPVAVQFAPLVSGILKDLVAQTKAKKIKIAVDAPPDLVFTADQSQVRQVLHNLIDNAVKYSPPGAKVAISARAARGRTEFSVRDAGMGIPQRQQGRVFEKFFRADNATDTGTPGTGLGLHLAKALVEAHGGRLWFESAENKGTTFFFTIPKV